MFKKYRLPLTGLGCVKKIVTNLAVVEVTNEGFKLLARPPGITVESIENTTKSTLIVDGYIPVMQI